MNFWRRLLLEADFDLNLIENPLGLTGLFWAFRLGKCVKFETILGI